MTGEDVVSKQAGKMAQDSKGTTFLLLFMFLKKKVN